MGAAAAGAGAGSGAFTTGASGFGAGAAAGFVHTDGASGLASFGALFLRLDDDGFGAPMAEALAHGALAHLALERNRLAGVTALCSILVGRLGHSDPRVAGSDTRRNA